MQRSISSGKATSKKDPQIRRNELLKALSPLLLKAIAGGAADLVATSFGCQFITEVLFVAEGDKSTALGAVAAAAAGNPASVEPPASADDLAINGTFHPSHIATTPFGGKMLKALTAGGRFDSKTKTIVPIVPALDFANILYPHIKDYVIEWATGSSSFVILALVESSNFAQRNEVVKILKSRKNRLSKAATEETTDQKAKREAAEELSIEENASGTGKKSGKAVKKQDVGNVGSALLLKML